MNAIREAMNSSAEKLGLDWNQCIEAGSIYGDHNPGPDGLDSLGSVSLAVELEDIFDVQIEPMIFVGINSPEGLEAIISKHLSS